MVQRLPGTLRARQAKAGGLKVDKPFACVRFSHALPPSPCTLTRLGVPSFQAGAETRRACDAVPAAPVDDLV